MATWPTISKLSSMTDKPVKNGNRKTSDAGYTMAFARGTVQKREFELSYTGVSYADKATIVAFFDTNQGVEFTFNHPDPDSSESFIVVFNQDYIEFQTDPKLPWKWIFNVKMVEV